MNKIYRVAGCDKYNYYHLLLRNKLLCGDSSLDIHPIKPHQTLMCLKCWEKLHELYHVESPVIVLGENVPAWLGYKRKSNGPELYITTITEVISRFQPSYYIYAFHSKETGFQIEFGYSQDEITVISGNLLKYTRQMAPVYMSIADLPDHPDLLTRLKMG